MNLFFPSREQLEYASEKTYKSENSCGHPHNEMLLDFDENVKWDVRHFASCKLQLCLEIHIITHISNKNITFEKFKCFQSINQSTIGYNPKTI